ncbi:hypothetical protein OG896_35335 [Streptomyces sp. NBC_00669]|uniref:hypothetical protein n=1 Tax=unclassified Streptomyces TaxID=2593676 RepID=UPI002E2052A8|nr:MULTISPECIES: hypothetical protein [unclassified Streptomyces]
MADAVDPTNEDNAAETETDNEVEAHSEAPLDLQEMGVNSPVVAPGSTVSLAACA